MSSLGAAALMGGASLLGAGLNAMSASRTNRIAQQQFQQNMAFQRYQYNDMKRYNSPANQVRMIRQAGMNPALMFGPGYSPTPIGDVGGVSSTASMSPVDYSGVMSAAASLSQASTSEELAKSQTKKNIADAEKSAVETAGYQIDNLYKDEFWKSSNYVRNSLAWLQDKQADLAKLELSYQQQSLGDRLFQQRWESEYKRAQAEAMLITNSYIPEQLQAQINDLIASAKQRIMLGTSSVKQAMASIMQAKATQSAFDAQYGGNPQQRSQFFNAILRTLNSSNRLNNAHTFDVIHKEDIRRIGYHLDRNGSIHRVGYINDSYLNR